jgi:hypothetical protein
MANRASELIYKDIAFLLRVDELECKQGKIRLWLYDVKLIKYLNIFLEKRSWREVNEVLRSFPRKGELEK